MPFTLQHIQDALASRPHADDAWQSVRSVAWARLQQIGLPHPRSNEFFWVPPSLLSRITLAPPLTISSRALPPALINVWMQSVTREQDLAALLPVLLCAGPRQQSLPVQTAWQDLEIFSTDPYALDLLEIPAQAQVRIHWNINGPQPFCAQRLDIHAGAGSLVEIVVDKNISSTNAWGLNHSRLHLEANATVRWLETDTGSTLHRTSVEAHLAGEGADFALRALSLLTESHQSHRCLRIFHEAPRVRSEQFVRHVLQGESQASCDSQVEILKDMVGTEAHQLVNSLLLSPTVKASAKPTLIIHNDDVKASHGTTCGDLDRNQIYYLNSRGLHEAEARRLLLSAFINSLVEAHPISQHRAQVSAHLQTTLRKRFL